MKITTHGEYLTQLTNWPLLFPVNVYLVREDDGLTLVDAGLGGMAPGILRAAQAFGAPIRRIVLTHAHADHVGSLDTLHAALPEAEVLMSARSARFLAGDRTLDEAEQVGKLRGGWKVAATRPTWPELLSRGSAPGPWRSTPRSRAMSPPRSSRGWHSAR